MASLTLKRILIIGDSLCLPRIHPEKVDYNETWPNLLRQTGLFEIFQIAIGGGTIKDLYEQISYYKCYNPDIVIIQSGIVDCAPRALGRIEKDIISSSRILSAIYNRLNPTKVLRKIRRITYISEKSFKNYLKIVLESFYDSQIIWIGILPASVEYEINLPGISSNIEAYNRLIQSELNSKRCYFLDTKPIPIYGIMTDYHHLNSIGHKWLSDKLLEAIIN